MNYPLNTSDAFYIFDNFYKQPEDARNVALNSKKIKFDGGYAGVMTEDNFLTSEIIETVEKIVGSKLHPTTNFTGKFRFTKNNDIPDIDIHVDPYQKEGWAGVCYLTPNVDFFTEGTIFWRHKETSLECLPFKEYKTEKWNKIFEEDGKCFYLWDKMMSIPFKYNRLVLFRPWLFHSPAAGFGDTFENCRLVQTFFFRNI